MERVRITHDFAHPPNIVWDYLLDHEGLVRWSGLDRVDVLRPVAQGGAGTVRHIELRVPPGYTLRFDEEICSAEAPHRFEYRVLRGLPLRHHYGVVTLEPHGYGTRLLWRVNYALQVPGLGALTATLLVEALQRALGRLDRLMRAEYSLVGERLDGTLPTTEAAEWHARAVASRDRLRACALRFMKAHSPHYWFARVYQRVQDSLLALVEEGHFVHPSWVLRLMVHFHELYESNLESWEGRPRETVEAHWREAFHGAERGSRWYESELEATLDALRRAIRAHVCEDLPRALATTFWEGYRTSRGVEYETFAEDFYRMAPVFEAAQRSLQRELPSPDLRDRLIGRVVPASLQRLLLDREFFDMSRERRFAFERGRLMLQLILHPSGAESRRAPIMVAPTKVEAGIKPTGA